jgi:hypothetical protein
MSTDNRRTLHDTNWWTCPAYILSMPLYTVKFIAITKFLSALNHPRRMQYIDIHFYADDAMIADENPQEVQDLLDWFTATFARVGLKMNPEKQSR